MHQKTSSVCRYSCGQGKVGWNSGSCRLLESGKTVTLKPEEGKLSHSTVRWPTRSGPGAGFTPDILQFLCLEARGRWSFLTFRQPTSSAKTVNSDGPHLSPNSKRLVQRILGVSDLVAGWNEKERSRNSRQRWQPPCHGGKQTCSRHCTEVRSDLSNQSSEVWALLAIRATLSPLAATVEFPTGVRIWSHQDSLAHCQPHEIT